MTSAKSPLHQPNARKVRFEDMSYATGGGTWQICWNGAWGVAKQSLIASPHYSAAHGFVLACKKIPRIRPEPKSLRDLPSYGRKGSSAASPRSRLYHKASTIRT